MPCLSAQKILNLGKIYPLDVDFNYSRQKDWTFQSGNMQSPININLLETTPMLDEGSIELNYDNQILYIEDTGRSIQVGATGVAKINGRLFNLEQFHFHLNSEHTLDEVYYPLEAHFVHEAQDGRLAVIGVLFKEGKHNENIQNLIEQINQGDEIPVTGSVNYMELIPENKSYYHYLGSLTTPPLLENVEWYIFSTSIEISKEQLAEFGKYYDSNFRAIQPLNGRSILFHQG